MGEVVAEGSRDMVGFPEGRGWPRARVEDGAEVYLKAGTAVCARTEERAATKVCTRTEVKVCTSTEVKVCTRTEITAVGRLTEEDAARGDEAAKAITAGALGRRGSRRNVD
ncbi:uncharacterized protein H6S33_002906 [Morchella sextelata]|uniref:uncharacterized protein n=1 Tax=Morchella sextelata TaxID=1174677 RepID=UPI001D04247E|nr:uncharacterized protein H6S33_002906 [Morchella sextelata]KAH0606918.1 hypothetical protein H6S33_002906 [Morchella sextelata]